MKGRKYGEQLKQCREINGMTQEDLARRLGLPQSTVSRMEKDVIVPGNDVIEQWCKATGNDELFLAIIGGEEKFKQFVRVLSLVEKMKEVVEFAEMTG